MIPIKQQTGNQRLATDPVHLQIVDERNAEQQMDSR